MFIAARRPVANAIGLRLAPRLTRIVPTAAVGRAHQFGNGEPAQQVVKRMSLRARATKTAVRWGRGVNYGLNMLGAGLVALYAGYRFTCSELDRLDRALEAYEKIKAGIPRVYEDIKAGGKAIWSWGKKLLGK